MRIAVYSIASNVVPLGCYDYTSMNETDASCITPVTTITVLSLCNLLNSCKTVMYRVICSKQGVFLLIAMCLTFNNDK